MNPLAVITLLAAAVAAAIATEIRLLPEVIDPSIILTTAGLFALLTTVIGAGLGLEQDRLARLALLGTVSGAIVGAVGFVIGLLIDVL